MKILVIGDIHAHPWGQFASVGLDGVNTRLRNTLNLLEELAKLSHTVDMTVQVGDVWHSRRQLDTATAALTVEAFKGFSSNTFCLVGNHDVYSSSAKDNTLKILPSNIRVIDEPTIIARDGLRIGFHPFTADDEAFRVWARQVDPLDLFFFHQGLVGGVVGAFNVPLPAHLDVADLPKSRLSIGGHLHTHQRVAEGVYYAGSLYQCDIGERGSQKVYMIVDITDAQWDFTVVPTSAPSFHLYPSVENARKGSHLECDFLRIQCKKSEVDAVKQEFPKAQVEVVKELVTEKRVITQETASSDATLLESFVQERKPELDHEKLMKLGMELLNEAD